MEEALFYLTNAPDNFSLREDDGFSAIVLGLDGNDLIQGTFRLIEAINGNSGNDTIIGAGGNDSLRGGRGDDLIYAGYSNTPFPVAEDPLEFRAFLDEQFITSLEGNKGNDIVLGGNGMDLILGGEGDDTLMGGNGGDFVAGDVGNDVLTGGNGNDRFLLRPSDGFDVITDFNVDEDLIVLGQDIFAIATLPPESTRIELPRYISLEQQGADVLVGTINFGDMALVQNVLVEDIAPRFAIATLPDNSF